MKIIKMIILLVLFAIVTSSNTVRAETTQTGCPVGEVLNQYVCPSNPWQECDPYKLRAQPGELFCEMFVYTNRPASAPYKRVVPGELCYPDPPWDGKVCMAFYSDYVAVWTKDKTYGIHSIYVHSMRRNVQFVPLVYK